MRRIQSADSGYRPVKKKIAPTPQAKDHETGTIDPKLATTP